MQVQESNPPVQTREPVSPVSDPVEPIANVPDPLPVAPVNSAPSVEPSLSNPSADLSSGSPTGGVIAPIFPPTASSIVYSLNYSVRPHAPTGDNLGHSFSYDANGNMTGLSTYATYTAMRYNHFNKLDTVQTGSAVTKYLYDDSGNRIAKMVGGQVTERYFGAVEQKNGETLHYYFHGSRRIAERNVSSGQLSFYHPDHLGSASVVTNNVGTELSRVDYYEFGATRQELGQRKEPFTYNDKRLDNETDFNDYGARMYAAKFMRFTSADTIVPDPTDPASLNRYAYVNNNPMKYVDPTGHWAEGAAVFGQRVFDSYASRFNAQGCNGQISPWITGPFQENGRPYPTIRASKDWELGAAKSMDVLMSIPGMKALRYFGGGAAPDEGLHGPEALMDLVNLGLLFFGNGPTDAAVRQLQTKGSAVFAVGSLEPRIVAQIESIASTGWRSYSAGGKNGAVELGDEAMNAIQGIADDVVGKLNKANPAEQVKLRNVVVTYKFKDGNSDLHHDGSSSYYNVSVPLKGPGTVIYPNGGPYGAHAKNLSPDVARITTQPGQAGVISGIGREAATGVGPTLHSSPVEIPPDRLVLFLSIWPRAR